MGKFFPAQQHFPDCRHQVLNISHAHLVEPNEMFMIIQMLINPTDVDGDLPHVRTFSTLMCHDAEVEATCNVTTYFTKNM